MEEKTEEESYSPLGMKNQEGPFFSVFIVSFLLHLFFIGGLILPSAHEPDRRISPSSVIDVSMIMFPAQEVQPQASEEPEEIPTETESESETPEDAAAEPEEVPEEIPTEPEAPEEEPEEPKKPEVHLAKVEKTDPEDTDQDGDGYTVNQGDCNDKDARIHPGATEICGDGTDQDCNGRDLACEPEKKPKKTEKKIKPDKKPDKPRDIPHKAPKARKPKKVAKAKPPAKSYSKDVTAKIAKIRERHKKKTGTTSEKTGTGNGGTGQRPGSGLGAGRYSAAIRFYKNNVIPNRINKNWTLSENLLGRRFGLRAVVVIRIMQNGKINDMWFEKKSGDRYFDDSVRKAIMKSNPLRELPNDYPDPFYEVELEFTPSGLN